MQDTPAIRIPSLIEGKRIVHRWFEEFVPSGNSPGRVILFLEGPLGSGKTTFVSWIAEDYLGSSQGVSSPTFTVEHVYREQQKVLYHIDVYRLTSWEEWLKLAVLERLETEENVFLCIEWCDRFPRENWENYFLGFTEQMVWIRWTITGKDSRELKMNLFP